MDKDHRPPSNDRDHTTQLETRRFESLPIEPGSLVFHVSPDLVVLSKPTSTDDGTKRATDTVCKCTATRYDCRTDEDGNTICKEVCTAWDCTTVPEMQ